MKFTLPIPKSTVKSIGRIFSGPLLEIAWRLLVITTGLTLLYALAVSSSGFFVVFLVGTTLSIVFSDDIRQFILDVYRRNFWVWRT